MKNTRLLVALTTVILLQFGCKKDPPVIPPIEPPPYQQTIFLSVVDSGLTEVYLKLSMTDTLPPREYSILRNNVQILSGSLFGRETTLVDTTAQRNTSYFYQAFRLEKTLHKDSSKIVTTRTLDTTSHDFVWTVDTIGIIGSGHHTDLFDVTIVNENNVWIGGYIHETNNAGRDTVYNLLHWNGQTFQALQVQHSIGQFQGIIGTNSIYSFGENNIIAGAGPSAMHWDGNTWTPLLGLYNSNQELEGDISNALWGTSMNNLYGVGNKGKIQHWDGNSWTRMPVNTTVDLKDIAGDANGENIWACGSNPYASSPSTLQKYQNGEWQTVWEGDPFPFRSDSLSGHLTGVIVPNKSKVLVLSRYGVYEVSSATNKTIRRNSFVPLRFPGFPWALCGNHENDFFVVGDLNFIAHYNGNTWKHYTQLTSSGVILASAAVKNNLVIAVGSILDSFNGRGIVIIGKRQ
ncbi:MAG: hypothetical protein WCW35_08135 [Bacteroidota bacterium]